MTTGRTFLSLAAAALFASSASAQVFVRAPFVRVETGGPAGTYIRAPFVNLYIPAGPPPGYFGPPPGYYVPGPPPPFPVNPGVGPMQQSKSVPQPLPAGPIDPKYVEPPVNSDFAPPAPTQVPNAPTIEEFVKSFKPKAGNYEITLTNPVNKRPEAVKFSLPGEPQRVRTTRDSVEFVYGPRRFVRIEFDQDGPIVITR